MNPMNPLQEIFDAIAVEGFSARVVALIDNYIDDILYGKTSFPRFNLSEHAGVCTGGAALMHPANVFIDELTDRPICIDCIVKFI